MKRQAKSIRAETIVVTLAISYLIFLALPVGIVAAYAPSLNLLGNGLFGLYILLLVALASYYISVLSKIIRKLPKESKSRSVVFSIEVTVVFLLVSCAMIIGGIVYDAVFIDHCLLSVSSETNSSWLLFLWLIHTGEFVGVLAIVYAIWPAKHGVKRKKSAAAGPESTASLKDSKSADRSADRKSFEVSTNLEADTWVDESEEPNVAQALSATDEKESAYVVGAINS